MATKYIAAILLLAATAAAAGKVEYPWGWIQWVMNSDVDPAAKQTLGIVEIKPGQRNPLHVHPNCEEVMYVSAGVCENIMAGKKSVMHAGDVVRIPAGVPHQAVNIGKEPLRSIVVYNTGTRQMIAVDAAAAK